MIDEKLKEQLDKDYMPIIYKNIRKFRQESGMTSTEVADVLEMSYDYIRRIEAENDKNKTCSLKLLIKFSKLFQRPLDDFLKE